MPTLHLVDAFASGPFTGNPAAVCVLDGPAEPEWMQHVAFELGYSETAYLHQQGTDWSLRWFTPTVEVELCGHATLASAHTLWELGRGADSLCFHTASGALSCTREGALIRMDFPRTQLTACEPAPGLVEALGMEPERVLRAAWDYVIELRDEASVRALKPDFRALGQVQARGIAVTSLASDPAYDFVSRFFAPGSGIDEDPVTGSAHCALAPFWSERLHKTRLRAFQASARGGSLEIELQGERVLLAGRAITVLRGVLAV